MAMDERYEANLPRTKQGFLSHPTAQGSCKISSPSHNVDGLNPRRRTEISKHSISPFQSLLVPPCSQLYAMDALWPHLSLSPAPRVPSLLLFLLGHSHAYRRCRG